MPRSLHGQVAALDSELPRERDFWKPYRDLVVRTALPYQWEVLNDRVPGVEPSHAIRNFRIAAGLEHGEFHGYVFQDSDVAKWLETVGYCLMRQRDPVLEARADEVIGLVAKAQQPDGYLNTYYTVKEPGRRWTNLHEGHELYCAGHFIEAGVAYHEATGKGTLLQVATGYADLISRTFGPGPGKLRGYCGHPEIELALVKLSEATGERRYLELALWFVDERGREPYYFDLEYERRGRTRLMPEFRGFDRSYLQAHVPVREQRTAEGHAVRVTYLYSAVADLARLAADAGLAAAAVRVWDNATRRRMYVTGGIGSAAVGEAFTSDYDLPTDTMYAETCASVGMAFWAQRMLKLDADARYADVMELELYNGALSGMSLDGSRYFYVNPLESVPERTARNPGLRHVKPARQPWYACACCPSNLTRLIASLDRYIGSALGGAAHVHLYVSGTIELPTEAGPFRLEQSTAYPYEGTVRIAVRNAPTAETPLRLRIPGWCADWRCNVNGAPWAGSPRKGYLEIRRQWSARDQVELVLDMPVRLLRSHPRIRSTAGKVCISRGPLIYCLEEADNGPLLHELRVSEPTEWSTRWEPGLLGGTMVIRGAATRVDESSWDEPALYSTASTASVPARILAVPYALWANRGEGEMLVWISSGA